MSVDRETAARLGFPKPKYMAVERERRWLCPEIPYEQIEATEQVTDLYVIGTRLRLREVRALNGDPLMFKLTRKADVDLHTRLVTSIYMPEHEFHALACTLASRPLKKLRHRLRPVGGVAFIVDEFQDKLSGLALVEAEFATDDQLLACPRPGFVGREVTEDEHFTGGNLVMTGLPRLSREASYPGFRHVTKE